MAEQARRKSKYALMSGGDGMRGFALNNLLRALTARYQSIGAEWGIPSSRLRNVLFTLFIGGVLTYGAGFAWYMLARFDLFNLIRDVNNDDSFYYFQIAWNLASGNFSTFDGGITRTNGYHPLWLLLITPFYWVFDKEAALFGIKVFEVMLIAGGAALVVAAARLARLPWILLFALLPLLYQQRGLFSGLEAAAGLFMLALFFLAVMLYVRDSQRWRWLLAAVAFSLPWVRLEYVAISLAATAALCLIEWSRRERPSSQPSPVEVEGLGTPEARGGRFLLLPLWEKARVRGLARSVLSIRAVVLFFAAVAGLLVYFAYNGIVFGGITPVSGATKQAWSQQEWGQEGGYSFVQSFRDVLQIPVFNYELLVALEVCLWVVLVWWFARRSGGRTDWLLLAFLVCVFGLAVGHLAKFAQTVLTVDPHWGSYDWYFAPAYLLMALIIPVRCYAAIHFIRRFIGPRSHLAANLLSAGIVVVGAFFLLMKADFTGPFRSVESRSASPVNPGQWSATFYRGAQIMNRVLPEDSVVGSWDAGIIGYFSRFPVVNLDGLVNSWGYFHATGVNRDGYAIDFGITHFAQLKEADFDIDPLFEYPLAFSARKISLWPIEPLLDVEPADWFWQRMEPHFDYESGDFGAIVDGRMAQAFAKDCARDELAVWSWTGAADALAVKAWAQTETGLCVAALMLPREAFPPVRVETVTVDDYLAGLVGDSPPAIRSDWDVYFIENRLAYVKEPCARADTEATFFLHLTPATWMDLPFHRMQHGFDNLDFGFYRFGGIFDGRCMATVALREYAIAEIKTGQYDASGVLWGGEIRLAE